MRLGIGITTFPWPAEQIGPVVSRIATTAAAGIGHALLSPRQAWDEATFDAVAAILPEVHAIEPDRG